MNFRNLGTWIGIGLVLALVVSAAARPPGGFWAPEGYVARANGLIERGGLQIRCGVQDSIVPLLSPGGEDERFYRSSYLRADVRRFNQNPTAARSPFLVDGCNLLAVDPYYHRIDLPYHRIPRWTGTLRFAGKDGGAVLSGRDGRTVELDPPNTTGSEIVTRVSPTQDGGAYRGDFVRFQVPGTREVAADAYFVGDDPVIADRRDVASPARLRLNGFSFPPGRMARIETGDWVRLGVGDRAYTYVVSGPEAGEILSAAHPRGEGWSRHTRFDRLSPFVEDLAQAIEGGLLSTPAARDQGAIAGLDVRLTLDRRLELGTEGVLADWCREHVQRDRPRSASAVVMDAFSGEVVAMPSCPGASELEGFGDLSRRVRSRFLRNQNLVSHPVGSALKPFWAAAVATSYPALLDLEIPEHPSEANAVLGCPLPSPYASAGHSEWEGLEHFLQTSCNRYLVDFASAALLARGGAGCAPGDDPTRCFRAANQDPAAGTPVRICDQVIHLVLAADTDVTGRSCSDLRLIGSSYAPAGPLSAITGGQVYREAAPIGSAPQGLDAAYRAGRYRLDLWKGPLEALQAAGDTADPVITSLRFAAVSPQTANLALNTVEDLRSDWVNLLLGGENSRWSNVELAEATARLLTGRDIRAKLVKDVGDETASMDSPSPLSEAALHPGARRRVLHAMETVLEPGGTAVRLGPAVQRLRAAVRSVPGAEGYEVRAFAKTGTPRVEIRRGQSVEEREGSVLVLGLLIVPPEGGEAASRRVSDFVSACPVRPGLRERILGVPPTGLLTPNRSLGFSVAVYLDDLDPEGDARAVELGTRLVDTLVPHVRRELAETVQP